MTDEETGVTTRADFSVALPRIVEDSADGGAPNDPDSGEILETRPKNELTISDQTVEFSGDVLYVTEFEDAVFVRCKQAPHDIYAFEADGAERWRSVPDERRGLLTVEDGELYERVEVSRTTDHKYTLDPQTGDRLDGEERDESVVRGYRRPRTATSGW